MTRSTLLYGGMLILLGVGLEGIRRIGSTLTPPRHIAGTWRITAPSSSSSCPILDFRGAPDTSLQVEQSGRYLTLTFTDVHSTRLSARFEDEKLQGSGPSPVSCARGTLVQVSGRLVDDRLEIVLTRASQTSVPGAPTFAFSAIRPSRSGSSSPTSQ